MRDFLIKAIKSLKDLTYDPKNARVHTEKNIDMLVKGLKEVGTGRSILIDADGEVIAGNGILEAAASAGITKVRVVDTTGDEIIAVRRSDLKGKKKTRMALLDNRSQEVGGGWNTGVLKDLLHEDAAVLKGLWEEDELEFLLNKTAFSSEGDVVSPESAAHMPEDSGIERVILWVPKDRHPEFVNTVRALGEKFNINDVTLVVLEALQRAHGES